MALTQFSGTWTSVEAAHLLRRTLFGPTFAQIQTATSDGLVATVNSLLTTPTITNPITFSPDETVSAYGETWINDPLPSSGDVQACINARNSSLITWLSDRVFQKTEFSIVEKMALFWQNHFGVDINNEPYVNYRYISLLYNNAIGNFKQLVKDATVEPAMLIFLNGNTNTLYSPNENFARELLELYTIGKGPQIGPGNYTNYTETDILEAAKIMTGWQIANFGATTLPQASPYFFAALHDTTTKTLSSAFGNAVISDGADTEYATFIDVIFQQNETAKFICRKLYRYFVQTEIDATTESTVISELANTMVANNYDVAPVLQELLLSEHFYDIALRGSIIKNPVEHIATMFKTTDTVLNYSLEHNAQLLGTAYYLTSLTGMEYFSPPNVAGWTAYYLQPSYSQLWINAALLKGRFQFTDWYTLYGGPGVEGNNHFIDSIKFLTAINDGANSIADPNYVVAQMEKLYACKPLGPSQKLAFKAILTNGLPDFEWTDQCNDYLANPTNPTFVDPVRNRCNQALAQMYKSAEFHIQ